ncbi:oxygenase MpaB family protein [Agrobacterium vitis]|nr:oxygenase MpaB family protein [Agrobacterium vitis]WEO75394.1 oxygenase MpaB family protein [Agrobacterium vitis]
MSAFDELLKPPPGMDINFAQPAGEPSLAPAGGVTWRVFSNPITMFVGGVSAVLLELAEPSVRSGVWDHSSFRTDPAKRLHRTGFAAMITAYAAQSKAREVIAHVVSIHDKVRGATPDGKPYFANDPRLLNWVQATATFGFTEAYHRFAASLSSTDKDAAFAESGPSAELFGATGAPRSWREWENILAEMAPDLEGSDILGEFLAIMNQAPILPRPLRWVQRLLVRAAVDITPEPVRSLPQLRDKGLRAGEALLITVFAHVVSVVPKRHTPAAQAAKRMGIRL